MPELLPALRPGSLSMDEIKDMVGTDAPVILELGANNGYHSIRFLGVFPKAQLFCFEPDPRAIRKWRARMNNRSELFEGAVGAVDGPVTFYTSAGRENIHPEGFDQAGSIRRRRAVSGPPSGADRVPRAPGARARAGSRARPLPRASG